MILKHSLMLPCNVSHFLYIYIYYSSIVLGYCCETVRPTIQSYGVIPVLHACHINVAEEFGGGT